MSDKPSYEDLEKTIQDLKKETEELKRKLAERDPIQSDSDSLFENQAGIYRNLFEQAGYGIGLVDVRTGDLSLFNKKAHEDLGYTAEEYKTLNARDLIAESDETVQKNIAEVLEKGFKSHLQKMIRKDGTIREFLVCNVSVRIEGKRYFQFVRVDITEQKEMERKLAESEEKYRLLVENANDGILIEQDGRIKFTNKRVEKVTGYSPDELKTIQVSDLIHPDDLKTIIERAQRRVAGERLRDTFPFRVYNKQHEILWVETRFTPVTWEGRPAALQIMRDITQQKMMESRIEQVNKMEALGTLAGGIAHDFNNLLMGIQGNASLMLIGMNTDSPHYERLRNIEKLVQSGSDLTKQLLGVAKGGKYEVKATDLNGLLEACADMFGRTKREITIHKKLQEDIWTVDVDRRQIDQVLLNFCVNAWHAMPGGGDLYLETKNTILDENYTQPYEVSPGRYVKVSVTDTGMGMNPAVLKRIFDPFFTTKEMGRGTGLGLASAYGIIRNHNGIINAYSEKGEGSTFNIYLPASEKEILDDADALHEIRQGTETILFVDDEEIIVEIGKDVLKSLGYNVITARSGSQALEIFAHQWDKIDLVILDMIMPEMGGGDTFDRLKAIDPSLNVLLSSGYSINGQAQSILDRGCKGFIQKPFSIPELSDKVREILDSSN